MGSENAITAKGLSLEQRQKRLAAMIAAGEITAEQSALIDFREPTKAVIQLGKRLAETRNNRASA